MYFLLSLHLCLASVDSTVPPISTDNLVSAYKAPSSDRLPANDKAHHFMTSAFLTGMSYYALKQELNFKDNVTTVAAGGLVLSIGFFKELYDGLSGKGTPSHKDLIADIVGIAVGLLILNHSYE